ncbi:MAG TPA: hypothetical protein VHK90_17675 [Thermoanaerobaculia bacterium]|nr:hypothetical protein [Thermoanaerobaculia bacterium]
MRRALVVLALVVLSACYGTRPPVMTEPVRGGVTPGSMPVESQRAPGGMPSACREIARARCAAEECKGANMDYVTLSCSGGRKVNRCVANLKCVAG